MIYNMIDKARKLGASDLHLADGCYPMVRVDGELCLLNGKPMQNIYRQTDTTQLVAEEPAIYGNRLKSDNMSNIIRQATTDKQMRDLLKRGEIDFAMGDGADGRCRVNIYKQCADYALAVRLINKEIPSCEDIGLPLAVQKLLDNKGGLLLITGPTGSGKSTTMAALINKLNKEKNLHIVTLEDPVEYRFQQGLCMINQREVGQDTASYATGLRSSLREDPDVIVVGELRDPEALAVALQAAETGHLVLSTLHTRDAVTTINRIFDMLPEQADKIRAQLADCLLGVASQMLLKRRNGLGRVAVWEILINNAAVGNIIREGRNHQLHSYIETSSSIGMQTMAQALQKLKKQGII